MPKYPDNEMTQFLALVKQANKGFRESASSLKPLCDLLRKDSQPDQILSAINQLKQNKPQQYQTYSAALAHVKSTFPGLQAQGMFGTQLAQGAKVELKKREDRIQAVYVTREIKQRYDGDATDTTWWVKLTFEDRPTTIVVKPMIRYRAKPNDAHGYQPKDDDIKKWKQQLQGSWKAKFKLVQGTTTTTKDVVFDIDFAPWDASTGNKEYKINVVNIPVQEAQTEQLVQQGLMAQGSSLQSQNWKVKDAARKLVLDGSSLGTPHLSQWGASDMQAIVHEFGHAIGNPDEYQVISHNVNYGGHETLDYNKPGFSTDSIMNDTKDGLVRKRHFAVVAALYKEWKQQQGGAVPVITVMEPSA